MTPDTLMTYLEQHLSNLYKVFYFKDVDAFLSSGVTDRHVNLCYVRPIGSGVSKYIVRNTNGITTIRAKYRIVVQSDKKYTNIENTIINILSTLNGVVLYNFTDDTEAVYKAEYSELDVIRHIQLHAFDFETEIELNYGCNICECITDCK